MNILDVLIIMAYARLVIDKQEEGEKRNLKAICIVGFFVAIGACVLSAKVGEYAANVSDYLLCLFLMYFFIFFYILYEDHL